MSPGPLCVSLWQPPRCGPQYTRCTYRSTESSCCSMSILLHYEMVVTSIDPTSHLAQSRDLVFRSGGGDLETSDGDVGSGDGQDDILWSSS